MSEDVWLLVLFCFGLIIGSFLNVVIWRLPRGESLSHPGSHCPDCGHPIRPVDNIPVVSWTLLRSRCRDCGRHISVRYPLVEVATGVAFAAVGGLVGFSVVLLPMLWFAAASIALALIDLDVRRLPNAIVIPSWVVVVLGFAVSAVVLHEGDDFIRSMLAGLAMGGAYLVMAMLYPAGMGMGDVKLAVLLGFVLGWFGWSEVVVGFFLGFLLGAVWGLALILTGRGTRKSAVPFGPFMIAGAAFSLFWGHALAQWYADLLL